MRNKKMVLLLTVGCLVVSSLTGCGAKKPTAEELVEGLSVLSEADYMDMTMELSAEMSASMGEFMDNATMSMAIGLVSDAERDKDTVFTEGTININVFGMDMDQPMKSYSQTEGTEMTTYDYDADSETWSYTVTEVPEAEESSIDASLFKDLKLAEVGKEDTEYVVTGLLSYSDLSEVTNTSNDFTDELLGSVSDGSEVDLSAVTMDVTMTFDIKTKEPKTVEMKLTEGSEIAADEFTISVFSLKIIINSIGEEKEVIVPEDVISSAVDASAVEEYDFDTDVDSSFSAEFESADTDETMLADKFESTGKYSVNSFKTAVTTNVAAATFYDYDSLMGEYTSTSFDMFDNEWYADITFYQFMDDETAAEYWDLEYGNEYKRQFFELSRAGEDGTVNGYMNDNVSYWKVDGANYDISYGILDGNTIVDIYGRVDDYDRTPTADDGEEMCKTIEKVLETLGYEY